MTRKGHKKTFWGDGNILGADKDRVTQRVCICENWSNCSLKIFCTAVYANISY